MGLGVREQLNSCLFFFFTLTKSSVVYLLLVLQADVILGVLPSSRLLFSTLCTLTGSHSALTASQLLNSGVLALSQTVLRLAGRQSPEEAAGGDALGALIIEDKGAETPPSPPELNGSELAKLMKIGARVVRGRDWKWGSQVTHLFESLFSSCGVLVALTTIYFTQFSGNFSFVYCSLSKTCHMYVNPPVPKCVYIS